MDKFGCVFKQHEINAVFGKYDPEGAGTIDYRQFAQVFALMGSGTNPNYNPVFQIQQHPPTEVLDKIRAAICGRGASDNLLGFLNTLICFLRADKNQNMSLNRHEFAWALKENGHCLSKIELDKLFRFFDANGDDKVSFPEFMGRLVNMPLCDKSRALVTGMWDNITKACGGKSKITIDDLKGYCMARCEALGQPDKYNMAWCQKMICPLSRMGSGPICFTKWKMYFKCVLPMLAMARGKAGVQAFFASCNEFHGLQCEAPC